MSNAAVSRETAAFFAVGKSEKGPIVFVGADGNNVFFAWRRQILRCKICGRAMLAPTFGVERSIIKRACCSSLCNRLLVYLGLGGHRTGSAGWCSAQRIYHPMIAGGNHTLIRVPPALQGVNKNPPFPEKRGILNQKRSIQYAERNLATGRAVSARLTARRIYQARIDTGTAGRAVLLDYHRAKPISLEFGPRHCRATGRAVLLDFRQAQPTRLEFAGGGSPQKSPASCETGDFDQNCPNSIRRADASDRSGSFTRLTARKNHQARVCPPGLPA